MPRFCILRAEVLSTLVENLNVTVGMIPSIISLVFTFQPVGFDFFPVRFEAFPDLAWFLATFSGSGAREGEFPSDEVEHGGHVFHRTVPASLTLHGREQAVETLHEGGRQTSSPMGLDPLQVTLDHPGGSGHRLEQFSGLSPHRVHPGAPVSEQLRGLLGILTLVDALKHQPHLVSHARHTPFQGHRLPLLRFFFRPVHSVLEPHPTQHPPQSGWFSFAHP